MNYILVILFGFVIGFPFGYLIAIIINRRPIAVSHVFYRRLEQYPHDDRYMPKVEYRNNQLHIHLSETNQYTITILGKLKKRDIDRIQLRWNIVEDPPYDDRYVETVLIRIIFIGKTKNLEKLDYNVDSPIVVKMRIK